MVATIPDDLAKISDLKTAKKFVVKSPPNALILSEMMDILPDAKHVFIMRDPRDVLVSHQRTGVAWTEAHRNFDMAVQRTAAFYNGYEKAKGREGLLLFKYEDVHQKFPSTFKRLMEFMELDIDDSLVQSAMRSLSFRAVTGRSHDERQGMNRRGVAGDWVKNLSWSDGHRFQQSPYWTRIMAEHGYSWQLTNVANMLKIALQAGIKGCTLQSKNPGLHMVWSLSDCSWDNIEAVGGILRRCREGMKLVEDGNIPYSAMLAGEIPTRHIRPLSNALKNTEIALEVNLDTLPRDKDKFTRALNALVKTTLPTLSALNGDKAVRAIAFGESWDLYDLARNVLSKHGIDMVSLKSPNKTTSKKSSPTISWLLCDSANTLTEYGQPEGFEPLQTDSWATQKNSITYMVAKLTASSLQDPLSLGFRTCFNDVGLMV